MTVIPFTENSKSTTTTRLKGALSDTLAYDARVPVAFQRIQPTAIVYCEGNFGLVDGKTANGLVRHSEKYKILSVIDSTQAGTDSGEYLDNKPNAIPVLANLQEAVSNAGMKPDYLIYGMAPATGMLSHSERLVIFWKQ